MLGASPTVWAALEELRPRVLALGYEDLGEAGVPGRIYFRKRTALRAFNLALVEHDGPLWRDNLAVRDYSARTLRRRRKYAAAKRAAIDSGARTLLAYSAAKATGLAALVEQARAGTPRPHPPVADSAVSSRRRDPEWSLRERRRRTSASGRGVSSRSQPDVGRRGAGADERASLKRPRLAAEAPALPVQVPVQVLVLLLEAGGEPATAGRIPDAGARSAGAPAGPPTPGGAARIRTGGRL